jgi:hypothetical protein
MRWLGSLVEWFSQYWLTLSAASGVNGRTLPNMMIAKFERWMKELLFVSSEVWLATDEDALIQRS